jgi:hypothetical protein
MHGSSIPPKYAEKVPDGPYGEKVLGKFEQKVFPKEDDAFSWINEASYPVTHETLLPLNA